MCTDNQLAKITDATQISIDIESVTIINFTISRSDTMIKMQIIQFCVNSVTYPCIKKSNKH